MHLLLITSIPCPTTILHRISLTYLARRRPQNIKKESDLLDDDFFLTKKNFFNETCFQRSFSDYYMSFLKETNSE